MEDYIIETLERINQELKSYGMEIKIEEEDGTYGVLVFNGTDWEEYAFGYYEHELYTLLYEVKSYALKCALNDKQNCELFVYRKVHGWTHDDPALIFSITETALFFRDNDGTIESVDDNPDGIDAYENREGSFCVVADEYDYAFKQIEEHDKNLFN